MRWSTRASTCRSPAPYSSHVVDVSDRGSVAKLVAKLPSLDVLINNAGVAIPDPPSHHLMPLDELQHALLDSPMDTWEKTFNVNVAAVYFVTVSSLHLLAASPYGGRVINISSMGSIFSDPNIHQPAYQVSKSAVNHLTRLLASKFREHKVLVNAIAPGYFPSEMNDPSNPKSFVARAKEIVPVKRAGTAGDISGTAIWLASRAGSYVNGQVIHVDGGRQWAPI